MQAKKRRREIAGQNMTLWQLDVMSNAFVIAIILVVVMVLRGFSQGDGYTTPQILTTELPIIYCPETSPHRATVSIAAKGGSEPLWTFSTVNPDLSRLLTRGAIRWVDGTVSVNFDQLQSSDFQVKKAGDSRELRAKFHVIFSDAEIAGKPHNKDDKDLELVLRPVQAGRKQQLSAKQSAPSGIVRGVGVQFQSQLTASGGVPPYKWVWSSGENWLQTTPNGVVTAQPPNTLPAGDYKASFTVSDSDPEKQSTASTGDLKFTLKDAGLPRQKPIVLTNTLPPAILNQPYAVTLASSDIAQQVPGTWRLDPASVGTNINLNDATGVLQIIPSRNRGYPPDGIHLLVTAHNDTGDSIPKELILSVKDVGRETMPLVIRTKILPTAIVGKPYDLTLSAIGGWGEYAWSATSTGPFNVGTDGHLTGTATTPTQGDGVSIHVQVTDQSSRQNSADLVLPVLDVGFYPKPLRVLTDTLPPAKAGQKYQIALSATGGVPDYQWSLKNLQCNDSFRQYISVSENGVLTIDAPKWPDASHPAENIKVTVNVGDSRQPATFVAASLGIMLLNPQVTATPPTIPATTLPPAIVSLPYEIFVPVRGGMAPYRWDVNGSLPAGLQFFATEGVIRGSPAEQKASDVQCTVTDAQGQTSMAVLHLTSKAVGLLPAVTNLVSRSWQYLGYLGVAILYVIRKWSINRKFMRRMDDCVQEGLIIVRDDDGGHITFKSGVSERRKQQLIGTMSEAQNVQGRKVRNARILAVLAICAYSIYVFA